MNVLKRFIDETFEMMTGLGEMKVAEAIFLTAVHDATETMDNSVKSSKMIHEVISLAYQGQNIIKMCSHLPRTCNAEKHARELNIVAHKIDNIVFSIHSESSTEMTRSI
uniref:Uncharacterized protein n=1 Tax=Caenorhabditis japonica TaxID=281687 RepID=A0A8R1DV93_CAEJA